MLQEGWHINWWMKAREGGAENADFRARWVRIPAWPPSSSVNLACYFSLCLSFLTFKMEIILTLTSQGCCKVYVSSSVKFLKEYLRHSRYFTHVNHYFFFFSFVSAENNYLWENNQIVYHTRNYHRNYITLRWKQNIKTVVVTFWLWSRASSLSLCFLSVNGSSNNNNDMLLAWRYCMYSTLQSQHSVSIRHCNHFGSCLPPHRT